MQKIGRLTLLQVENVGIIKTMALHLDKMGDLVRVTGPNGAGKSYALNSILYGIARASKIPEGIVRDGTQYAKIKMKTGEGYTFTRTIKKVGDSQQEQLVVTKDGAPIKNARAFLDSMTSEFLDPSTLIDLNGDEVYKRASSFFNLSDIDNEIEQVKSDSKEARALIKAIGQNNPPAQAKAELGEYDAAITTRDKERAKYNEEKETYDTLYSTSTTLTKLHENTRLEIAKVELQLVNMRNELKNIETLVAEMSSFDSSKIPSRTRLDELERLVISFAEQKIINAKWDEYQKNCEKLKAHETRITTNAKKVDELEVKKSERTSKVGSVKFNEGRAIIGDRNWELCSTSQKILAAIDLAAAGIPEDGLRVLYIHRGESIGADIRAKIAESAERLNLQIFMEVFDEKALLPEDGVIHIIDGNVLEEEYRTIEYNEETNPVADTKTAVVDLSRDEGSLF